MKREKEECNRGLEIQSSILGENAPEFMSCERRVGLEGWRWLGGWTGYDRDHAIDLKDMSKPKKGHIIPLSPAEQEEVMAFLDDQLKKGYIHPSKFPQTSPVFFVPKKDGKKQMVQDYQYLNEHTVKNNYPLPLIAQLVGKLQGAKLFTKMDLRWRYNNVHIKENDEWKAAFTCFCRSFEP